MNQKQLDWLIKSEKIPVEALISPSAVTITEKGYLYFYEDDISWHPKTRIFDGGPILGQENIDFHNPRIGPLVIHETPLDWLRARRKGIVVSMWPAIFDLLRDIPVISIPQTLRQTYDDHMRPLRLPQVINA